MAHMGPAKLEEERLTLKNVEKTCNITDMDGASSSSDLWEPQIESPSAP